MMRTEARDIRKGDVLGEAQVLEVLGAPAWGEGYVRLVLSTGLVSWAHVMPGDAPVDVEREEAAA